MKKSYLESALSAHRAEQNGEEILQEGIKKIDNCLNGLLLDFSRKDYPLIVTVLEKTTEEIKKIMFQGEKTLVEELKGAISSASVSVDVEE